MKSTTEGVGAAKPLGAAPPFSVVLFFMYFVLYRYMKAGASFCFLAVLLSFFVIMTLPLAIMIVSMSVQDWVKYKISRVI